MLWHRTPLLYQGVLLEAVHQIRLLGFFLLWLADGVIGRWEMFQL